ncbi:hypothetical protein [Pseudocitrobacter vendiensis]|uniref:hypothetical protein n=1 Tax=Pseudocitrobacter vendiensis TaxID=2488306 RepID=UPI0020A49792|nr:hypothetical protein [Pseudocitrobacter vendiensis]
MSERVVVENNALSIDEDEHDKETGDRPVKVYPVNPFNPGIVDENGEPLKGGGGIAKGKYSNLTDSPAVGPGKSFTRAQKAKIYQQNMNDNGGVLRSDLDGQELVMPRKSQSGVTPPPNEAQIDHIVPKKPADSNIQQGTNSYNNAQVLSREQNRKNKIV